MRSSGSQVGGGASVTRPAHPASASANSKWRWRHGMRRKVGVIVYSPYLAAPAGESAATTAPSGSLLKIQRERACSPRCEIAHRQPVSDPRGSFFCPSVRRQSETAHRPGRSSTRRRRGASARRHSGYCDMHYIFLTCRVPRRCFILPNSTSVSHAVLRNFYLAIIPYANINFPTNFMHDIRSGRA